MNDKVINYINELVQVKNMLNKNIISMKDFEKIERKLAKKYELNNLSLYRPNDLINKSL